MNRNTLPDSLHDCLYGYIKTQVLYSCHSHGIFELLMSKTSGCNANQVSQYLQLNEQKCTRLLDIATLLGLLVKKGGLYDVSSDCRPFLSNKSESYQGAFISHIGDSSYIKFKQLKDLVKNDVDIDSSHHKEVFDDLYEDQGRRESFMEAMWNIGIEASRELVKKLDLNEFSTVVDIGGGNGSFVIPLTQHHSHINSTIFDVEPVRSNALKKIDQYDLQARVDFKAGDFWKDPFPKSDVFVFGFILSDWPTEAGIQLLSKAKDALNENGMIIILEKLFENEKSEGPIDTSLLDMAMMVEARGMHRTEAEYKDMLMKIGANSTFLKKSSGSKHLIAGQF